MKSGWLGRGQRRLKAKCCGKRSYVSQIVAEKALARILESGRPKRMPTGVYQCAHSGFWHLTSKQPNKTRPSRYTGPPRTVRELVFERDDWTCVVCGTSVFGNTPTGNLHHRRNRGQGGSSDPAINHPSNLLTVCGSGSTLCHGYIGRNPREAVEAGWSIPLNAQVHPVDVPFRHWRLGLVLIDDEGEYRIVAPAAEGGAA